MRRPKLLSLAVAGLALSAASAVEAGLPTVCSTCNGQPEAPRHKLGLHSHKPKKMPAQLCNDCAAKLAAQGPIPASAPCATCGEAASPMLLAGSTPGYAVVGEGGPATMTLASSGGAPGYAIVGGSVVSSEPAPIGVMRTNYQSEPAAAAYGTPTDIMHGQQQPRGAMGPGAGAPGNIPYAKASEMPGSLYAPQNRRPRIFSRMLGLPDFSRRAADMEAAQRAAHAQISYGAGAAPSEIPASMVYGSGPR